MTGQPPFTGRPGQVLEMHITHRPKAPSRQVEGIAPWLDELVLTMLDKSPERRPSASAVMKALAKGHTESPLTAPPLLRLDTDGQPVPLTAVEQLAEHKSLVLGGLAVLVALGLAALLVAVGAAVYFSG